MLTISMAAVLGHLNIVVKDNSLLNYSSSQCIISQCIDDIYCEPQKNNTCQSKCVTLGLWKDLGHLLMKTTECSTRKHCSSESKSIWHWCFPSPLWITIKLETKRNNLHTWVAFHATATNQHKVAYISAWFFNTEGVFPVVVWNP